MLTCVRGVVEWVAGDEGAAVQTSGQHELYLGHPLLDGVRLGLRVLVVLLEVVREVAIEIETHRVVAPLAAVAGAFARHLEAVGVH